MTLEAIRESFSNISDKELKMSLWILSDRGRLDRVCQARYENPSGISEDIFSGEEILQFVFECDHQDG